MKPSPEKYNPKLIIQRSKNELLRIADNLSKGKYKEESQQRKRILQMIADELKESKESPP